MKTYIYKKLKTDIYTIPHNLQSFKMVFPIHVFKQKKKKKEKTHETLNVQFVCCFCGFWLFV